MLLFSKMYYDDSIYVHIFLFLLFLAINNCCKITWGANEDDMKTFKVEIHPKTKNVSILGHYFDSIATTSTFTTYFKCSHGQFSV